MPPRTRFQQLERIMARERSRLGLIGSQVSLRPLVDAPETRRPWKEGGNTHITAHTTLTDWRVEIAMREEWRPGNTIPNVAEFLQRIHLKPEQDDAILVQAATMHELGHNRICPTSLEDHVVVLQGISEGIIAILERIAKEIGTDIIVFKELIDFLANAFEDLVDNTGNGRRTKYARAGLSIFYSMQIPYSPFYATFTELNLRGWGRTEERAFLHDALQFVQVDPAYRQRSEELRREALFHLTDVYQLDKRRSKALLDKGRWYESAKAFAEYMGPMILMARADGNGIGNGTPLFAVAAPGQAKGGVMENGTGFGGNPFQEAFDRDMEARKRAMKGWAKGDAKTGMGPAGRPHFMQLDEALAIWYEINAPPIEIRASGDSAVSGWPLIPYGSEPFDPMGHRLSDIRGVRIQEGRGGRLVLGVESYSDRLSFPIEAPNPLEGCMDFGLICDCSGSMHGGGSGRFIPWGDESPFHHLLLGFNGSLNYLAWKKMLPYILVNMTFFSDATISSGWIGYDRLPSARRFACRPQFGGTELDMRVIRQQYANRKPAVVALITDTAIYNWRRAGPEFIDIMRKHRLFVLRTGMETEVSRALKAAGFPEIEVEDKRHLEGRIMDATEQGYGRK